MGVFLPSTVQNVVPLDGASTASKFVDNLVFLTVQLRKLTKSGREPLAVSAMGSARAVGVVDEDGKRLVEACVRGDEDARRRFRERFLPLIYRFEQGGSEHEAANQDFFTFLFHGDRLYRRLGGFRGDAPLREYLWSFILPDLLKQFRAAIRRQRLDTEPLDGHPAGFAAPDGAHSFDTGCDRTDRATALIRDLPFGKRMLLKLLYIEDFDVDAAEVQALAERTGRSVREVLERVEAMRAVVREREAAQHERLEAAASAGDWIRLYDRRLAQLDADLVTFDPGSSRAAQLRSQQADLREKRAKRERQRAERLQASGHTVVTSPTEMVADLLGQPASTTRAQITRVRQEVAALLARTAPSGVMADERD